MAHFNGKIATRDFYDSAREISGWSESEIVQRQEKVRKLLASDSSSFFSEVALREDGRHRVTDGHHRATIVQLQGASHHLVIHTVKVHRR